MRSKLTLLALVAGASFAAQAGTSSVSEPGSASPSTEIVAQAGTTTQSGRADAAPSGNEPLPTGRSTTGSGTERSDVRAESAAAAKSGHIATGNEPHPKPRPAGTTSMESRSDVRSDATGAAKSGAISTGNEPHPADRKNRQGNTTNR